MNQKADVGDWVRLMRGGVLVIAEVRYVDYSGFGRKYVLDTNGTTTDENIYEVRKPSKEEADDRE